MKDAKKIMEELHSSDTEKVAKILNTLDGESIVLVRTYMTALSDRQRIEEVKLVAAQEFM